MAARLRHDHAWINILFRVVAFGFATATYLVGAVMLTFGTLLSALYLAYRWLREGVWHSYSLADVLEGESGESAQSEAWFLEAPLLVAMPTVGGALVIAGLAVFLSVNLVRNGNG